MAIRSEIVQCLFFMGRPASRQRGPLGAQGAVRRRSYGTPNVIVRLPAVEETLRQVSLVAAVVNGRRLTPGERALARPVFERSIDYDRVRLIETGLLEYRTVGNVIRVEQRFRISEPEMAKTLIHELTHVWQYQQSGTGYMSAAIQAQIGATIRSGSRNTAYDYRPTASRSFFSFGPEQQGLIVENYFGMVRDQSAPASQANFMSNHMDVRGAFYRLGRRERMAEIARELPIHEQYIGELRITRPCTETQILTNPSEFKTMPALSGSNFPASTNTHIFRPLLRIEF